MRRSIIYRGNRERYVGLLGASRYLRIGRFSVDGSRSRNAESQGASRRQAWLSTSINTGTPGRQFAYYVAWENCLLGPATAAIPVSLSPAMNSMAYELSRSTEARWWGRLRGLGCFNLSRLLINKLLDVSHRSMEVSWAVVSRASEDRAS